MSVYLVLLGLAVGWVGTYLVLRVVFSRKVEKGENISLYPLFLLLRTRKAVEPLDRLANRYPRFWDVVSRIAIVASVGLAAFAVYFLASNLSTFLFRPQEVGPQNIVIPLIIGVTIRLEQIPFLLLAFGIILLTHEGMHGIIARREGLPVKSAGIFLFFILPGGFVEPEPTAFRGAHPDKRLRVAAVGSFANLVTGLLAILLVFTLFSTNEGGLMVVQVSADSRLPVNEVIVEIDGIPVNSFTARNVNITLGKTITVKGLGGEYTFTPRPEFVGREFPIAALILGLGASQLDFYFPLRFGSADPLVEYNLYKTLNWIQIVSIGVAVFNMLPIQMLDGSLMLRSFLERYIKSAKRINAISLAATAACLLLLGMNIFMTYNVFGFFQL